MLLSKAAALAGSQGSRRQSSTVMKLSSSSSSSSSLLGMTCRFTSGEKDVSGFQTLCREGRVDEALAVLLRMEQHQHQQVVHMYKGLLQACKRRKALAQAKQVHALLAEYGWLESHAFLGDLMVTTLVSCGSLADGVQLFHSLPHRTVFSWTAIISGYSDAGLCEEAVSCYERMQQEGVQPDNYTFVAVLKACGRLEDLDRGKRIHGHAVGCGFGSDEFVGNTLVSMYAKCGSVLEAEQVFGGLSRRDVVAWNAMLAAYAQQEEGEKALDMYQQMQVEGVEPDARTFVSVLQACGSIAEREKSSEVAGKRLKVESLRKGREIHAGAEERGFTSNVFVGSTLVSMYGRCGSIKDAERVFGLLSQRNVVSWTSMITAYAQQEQGANAIKMYEQMQNEGVRPNSRTFVAALQACCSLAEEEESAVIDGRKVKLKSLLKGRELHGAVMQMGFDSDAFVGSALVHMYAKCGSIKDAEQVFDRLPRSNVVSWTVMIAAYTQHGQGEKALQLYTQMQAVGVSPNEATFLSVLEACSITGALDICLQTHETLVPCGLERRLSLATSLIHAYSKCGSMADAQRVFDSLQRPDVVSWNALLAGHARLGDCAKSVQCYEAMCCAGMKPNAVTFLALLTACTHGGRVDKGLEYFESMSRDHGIAAGLEHYACVIDLVGRAGFLGKAEDLIQKMPMQSDLPLWLCLLGACRKHGNVVVGKQAFDAAVGLDPKHAAAYILMSSIYADAGMQDRAVEVDDLRQSAVEWKQPGQSWIEHEREVSMFQAGEKRHEQHAELYLLLKNLTVQLKETGILLAQTTYQHPTPDSCTDHT